MGHALLSPSSASRWLACTPSARLESQFPDTTSEAAKEGTLAHQLGETLLQYKTGAIKTRTFNKIVNEIEADPLYTSTMRGYMDDYAALVLERFAEAQALTPGAVLMIEQHLDITEYVPEGFGTGDTVIIADGTMEIIDLKYGKGVPVYAEENKQMMLYALGALHAFDLAYSIDTIRMTIYQPRLDNISSWEISATTLRKWAENELKPRAAMAFQGQGDYVSGSHCRFCRAKAQCRALATENLQLARYDFQPADTLTDDEITDVLNRADAFKRWITSIEEYTLSEAVNKGKAWPGYKLVEGRSIRVYFDAQAVADTLVTAGVDEAIIYDRSVRGLTAMEKVLGKKEFGELLGGLIVRPQGKPTLAPESDKRPEWNSAASAQRDFSNN